MADVLENMLGTALDGLDRGDRKRIAEIKRLDDVLDRLNSAIKAYLTSLDPDAIDYDDDRQLSEILAFVTNLEHTDDIVERGVAASLAKRLRRILSFSREGTGEIREMLRRLALNVRTATAVFMTDDVRSARGLLGEKDGERRDQFAPP
jgi:phosphate:Na+ symporter